MIERKHQYFHSRGKLWATLKKIGSLLRPGRAKRIWNGVYSTFSDAPLVGSGYEEDSLAIESFDEIRELRKKTDPDISLALNDHTLLSTLISTAHPGTSPLRVLDFGGGSGGGYLRAAICTKVPFEYFVVETAEVAKHGNTFWRDTPQIRYRTEIPSPPFCVDIVYVCSALQYVDDYPGVIKKLCMLRPQYILLAKLSAGNFESYITLQENLPGSKLRYRFLSHEEVVSIFRECGYALTYQDWLPRVYNQNNFPSNLRMHRASNLIFCSQVQKS